MQIVLATHNLHKMRELRWLLKDLPNLDLRSLRDFPHYVPPEETGQTFEENAALKATHAANALKQWVLSDDSGLVVPILGGAPGVFSARYAGKGATDIENYTKLLHELKDKVDLERAAYFHCCLTLANPEGWKKSVHGLCEGMIVEKPRGKCGFGYDPIFMKHDYMQTFGELEENIKNRISHRSKAAEKLLLVLEGL